MKDTARRATSGTRRGRALAGAPRGTTPNAGVRQWGAQAGDRCKRPRNIGTLVRSADAFGASGVIVTGHAADVYDPKAVRASTGSLFSVPVVRVPSHRPVVEWVEATRTGGVAVRLVGTDENGERDIAQFDFTQPTLVLVGNETTRLSAAWRDACYHDVRIPMFRTGSSLDAASAECHLVD